MRASHSPADAILEALRDGQAHSRSALAKALQLSPSTVSLHVERLISSGMLEELGDGESSGGRKPRMLRICAGAGQVLAADLGTRHARLGRFDLTGQLLESKEIPIEIGKGPQAVWALIEEELAAWLEDAKGIGVSLPGPVVPETGAVVQPSRMPGWSGFESRQYLEEALNLPVAVDNDANLMALGEHRTRMGKAGDSITVKAGAAIGSGLILGGEIHHGATNAAGDITHTRVQEHGRPCACGNTGCLETVASGVGLVQQLKELGQEVDTTEDVLALIEQADPQASALVRQAGGFLGQALSGVVNFTNPDAVFITGLLSSNEPFLAAVRSRIYENCHPLVTQSLKIEAAATGRNAGMTGAAQLVLDSLHQNAAL
ncbi:MAG: ROK family transcriptional regulator [Propionibacteriaceae bacterium]|nr:ROK family transcriptional regulator [Propionibacteriaceae bacterium]